MLHHAQADGRVPTPRLEAVSKIVMRSIGGALGESSPSEPSSPTPRPTLRSPCSACGNRQATRTSAQPPSAFGRSLNPPLPLRTPHYRKLAARVLPNPVPQLPRVAAVRPDDAQVRESPGQTGDDQIRPVPSLVHFLNRFVDGRPGRQVAPGASRQAHPERAARMMPLTTSRRSARGLPRRLGGGSMGSTMSHRYSF